MHHSGAMDEWKVLTTESLDGKKEDWGRAGEAGRGFLKDMEGVG